MSDQPQNTNSGREIIVAVDGSEASNTAVLWAANAALKRNQPLKLVSACLLYTSDAADDIALV